MDKKHILIINTGGTIGMVRTDEGFAPRKGALARELTNIRDLSCDAMPSWDMVEFDPLLDSTNIRYNNWNQIADAIADGYDFYDGFVVLHGTDTLAYSASALSFMLEGLGKPVVFTGSQIPLCELRSDGKDNLITSMLIASEGVVREVSLFFGDTLRRGNRSVKQSADGMMAFASPNYPKLAKAGVDIDYRMANIRRPDPGSQFRVTHMRECRLGVVKVFPGIQFSLFAPIVHKDLDGLILETFGTGNIPEYDRTLTGIIHEACSQGTTVVVCTQCAQGTVRLGAYKAGSALVRAGAVSGGNMTTEAAVTKLTYLLSKGLPSEEIRRLMATDIRGEMTSS